MCGADSGGYALWPIMATPALHYSCHWKIHWIPFPCLFCLRIRAVWSKVNDKLSLPKLVSFRGGKYDLSRTRGERGEAQEEKKDPGPDCLPHCWLFPFFHADPPLWGRLSQCCSTSTLEPWNRLGGALSSRWLSHFLSKFCAAAPSRCLNGSSAVPLWNK